MNIQCCRIFCFCVSEYDFCDESKNRNFMFNSDRRLLLYLLYIHAKIKKLYRVSHKKVQVFDEVFLNIQNIFFKKDFFNRIEERST